MEIPKIQTNPAEFSGYVLTCYIYLLHMYKYYLLLYPLLQNYFPSGFRRVLGNHFHDTTPFIIRLRLLYLISRAS